MTKSAAGNMEIFSGLGVFNDNRKLPLHRRYPFVEGLSSHLVASAMDQKMDSIDLDSQAILDMEPIFILF